MENGDLEKKRLKLLRLALNAWPAFLELIFKEISRADLCDLSSIIWQRAAFVVFPLMYCFPDSLSLQKKQ